MNAVTETRMTAHASVARVRPAAVSEWRAMFDADDDATFFHGPAWAELWEAYTSGAVRADPWLVEFADGASAILGITRTPTRVPWVVRDTLSPEGNCGGWVSADVLDSAHVRALADIILRAPSFVWRVGPADEDVLAVAPPGGREECTHLIDLRDGPAAAGARWRQEARRLASRARRQGLHVREGTSQRDWEAYVRLYHASVERWESPLVTYRDSLFPLLSGRAHQGIRLWLAELDGEPCAGAVVLSHHRYATGWLSAAAPERCPGAGNFLHWELLGLLADLGMKTYDMGGSGPLAGVVRFKESLGATRTRVVAYERRHPLERAASAAGRLRRNRR
jgi:hypothetical protein